MHRLPVAIWPYWETLSGDSVADGQRIFSSPEESTTLDEIATSVSGDIRKRIDKVVRGLCPLALHGKPIADFVSWHYRSNENDYHRWMSTFVGINTSDKIPSHIKNKAKELLQDGESISASWAEGIEALANVHLKIRNELKDRTANARLLAEKVIEEWKTQTDKECSDADIDSLFSIFERNKGCELDKAETNIGLSHDKHTRLLEDRYHATPSFSKLQIEIVERHNKPFLSGYKIALAGRIPNKKKFEDKLEARGASIARISQSVDMVIKTGELTARQKEIVGNHPIMVVDYSLMDELIGKSTPPERPRSSRPRASFSSLQEHMEYILGYYGMDTSALGQASSYREGKVQ